MLNNYQITAGSQEEPTLRKCISLAFHLFSISLHCEIPLFNMVTMNGNSKDLFNIFFVIFLRFFSSFPSSVLSLRFYNFYEIKEDRSI